MQMLEIKALDNGAHMNQTCHGFLPDGWAVIPDSMTLENFPFGEVEAANVGGIMTVTKWTSGTIPEPEPQPEPEPTLDERVTTLEEETTEAKEALEMILSGVTE